MLCLNQRRCAAFALLEQADLVHALSAALDALKTARMPTLAIARTPVPSNVVSRLLIAAALEGKQACVLAQDTGRTSTIVAVFVVATSLIAISLSKEHRIVELDCSIV